MTGSLITNFETLTASLQPLDGQVLPLGVVPGTDLAGAHLLHEHHGSDLLFVPEHGWHEWDGKRFVHRGMCGPSRRVQNIGRRLELGAASLQRSAALADGEDRTRLKAEATRLAKWAASLQSAVNVRHVLELAQTLCDVRADQLDRDPWLLNVENGTIELRTGVLREHRREDKITRLAPVHFDPQAHAPRWEKFLTEVLPDASVRAYVRRFFGYALTGCVHEHVLVNAIGPGANGKSVLTETVRRVLGDHALDTPTTTLMAAKHGRGIENDLARLKGARLVCAKETEQDRRLDESRVKALVGGDTIAARFLFREFFEFQPSFKLWLHANHRPTIRGTDEGIWRRIHLVLFEVTIPAAQRDPALIDVLQCEAPGILADLVRACLEWQRSGLQPPAAVQAATAQWRAESDDVTGFVNDSCVVGAQASVAARDLYVSYTKWVQDQGGGKVALSQRSFGERLGQLGYQPGRGGMRGRFWRGIALHAEEDPNGSGGDDNGWPAEQVEARLKGWS